MYYSRLRSTPHPELIAGNLSRSLSKNILKVIASELKKSKQLHNNVVLELSLTQDIIRECDSHVNIPGYIQVLQMNPFAVHLSTEVGVSVLVNHLRSKKKVALYLDATGGVVRKIPGDNKRVFYYALTLPGAGRDAPPLPVCELLSNNHSVPPLAYWLLQFLHTLGKYTTHRVNQIETDFSWALMQATLLAFNRESVDAYLARTYTIINRQKRWDEIKPTTILHLCSAHIIKAVSNTVSRKTDDPGLREFVTFVFARIQNTVSLQSGQEIFKHLCTVLLAEHVHPNVHQSLDFLQQLIAKGNNPTLEDGDIDSESQSGWEEEEQKRAQTIVGRSPYTQRFQEAFQEAQATIGEAEEDENGHQPNRYHCPEILKVLFSYYMGIFPLWSGAMLGDLRRYARDKTLDQDTSLCDTSSVSVQTRDTNCHVEAWFGIVKHSILSKKTTLRPAEFIRTMYSSLKGRYIEHILRHNLPENILLKPIKSKKKCGTG